MACEGCDETLLGPFLPPDQRPALPEPRPNPPQPAVEPRGYVVYGGGPPERMLHLIGRTLPADDGVQRDFGRPTFHSDGRIEYPKRPGDWEPPAEIDGYERDGENKWLFHPKWDFCNLRMMGAALKENCGCISVVSKCMHPLAPTFNQFVTHADCSTCPHRRSVH